MEHTYLRLRLKAALNGTPPSDAAGGVNAGIGDPEDLDFGDEEDQG